MTVGDIVEIYELINIYKNFLERINELWRFL